MGNGGGSVGRTKKEKRRSGGGIWKFWVTKEEGGRREKWSWIELKGQEKEEKEEEERFRKIIAAAAAGQKEEGGSFCSTSSCLFRKGKTKASSFRVHPLLPSPTFRRSVSCSTVIIFRDYFL